MQTSLHRPTRGYHAREQALRLLLTAILWVLGAVFIFPLIWMLSTSVKIQADVYKYPIQWIPEVLNFGNYRTVLFEQTPSFFVYYWNSIKITGLCVVGNLLTSSLAAYGFSKTRFRGRDQLFLLYLCGLMIPFQVQMVPRFLMFRYMAIYNTHWALILPGLFTTLGVFLLRQAFLTVPRELSESAMIDGAGHLRTFWQIVIPLAKPTIAGLCILTFVWRWNDYEGPLIFITRPTLYTLPLGLTNFIEETGNTKDTLIMAASVCALLPVVAVFLAAQKYIIGGLTAGGVKG